MLIFLIFIKLHPRGKIKLNKTNGRFPIIISWDFHSKKDRNFFLNIITDFYNRINFPLTILFQFEYTALKQQNNPFHSRNYYSGWDVKFPGNKTGQCCTVHDFGKIHSSTRSNDIIQISWNRNKRDVFTKQRSVLLYFLLHAYVNRNLFHELWFPL